MTRFRLKLAPNKPEASQPEDSAVQATRANITRFTTVSTEGGLRSLELWDVRSEKDGTLWIATSEGISRRTPEADWSYYDIPGARKVWPEANGAVWVGTLGGLYRLQQDILISVPE